MTIRPADPNSVTTTTVGEDGDRRQITVLFVDLVEYTPLAEAVGEETLYRIIRPITEQMVACVERHGGTVQDLTGDGIMALFGAPSALEDAPLRACRAALDIRAEIVALALQTEQEYGVRPRVRIGLHSGAVVLGRFIEKGVNSLRAVGDTVNVAARFESAADPGSILMSAETYRLVEGFVEAEFAGKRQLKGKSEALEAYVLEGLTVAVDRFTARISARMTPWVGRAAELSVLEEVWSQACEGSIRLTVIQGEAGIGKSRLVHEFVELLHESSDVVVLKGHCVADSVGVPFLPFIEVVRRAFRIGDSLDGETIRRRLRDGLLTLGLGDSSYEPYLANLLTGERDDRLAEIDGERMGRRTLEALQGTLMARCRMSPTIRMSRAEPMRLSTTSQS